MSVAAVLLLRGYYVGLCRGIGVSVTAVLFLSGYVGSGGVALKLRFRRTESVCRCVGYCGFAFEWIFRRIVSV